MAPDNDLQVDAAPGTRVRALVCMTHQSIRSPLAGKIAVPRAAPLQVITATFFLRRLSKEFGMSDALRHDWGTEDSDATLRLLGAVPMAAWANQLSQNLTAFGKAAHDRAMVASLHAAPFVPSRAHQWDPERQSAQHRAIASPHGQPMRHAQSSWPGEFASLQLGLLHECPYEQHSSGVVMSMLRFVLED